MTWRHITLVTSSASPSSSFVSLHCTHPGPLAALPTCQAFPQFQVFVLANPFSRDSFLPSLLPVNIHISRRLSERTVPGYSPPSPPPLHLIFEIFLAHVIVCSLYLLCFTSSSIYLPSPNGRLRVAKDFRDMAVDKTKKP